MRNIIFATILLLASPPAHAQSLTLGPRDVYIRGDIDEPMAVAVTKAIGMLNLLGMEEITIHITSGGGSVIAGLQIYDTMQESLAPIRTICEGYCMSMAAVLLASGDKRESQESATIMFHQVSTQVEGKISVILEDIAEAERLQGVIDDHLHKHTGLSLDAVRKMESYDHFMSPQEAKSLGIIDVIRGKHGKPANRGKNSI